MKRILIILFAVLSAPTHSQSLCGDWKPELRERRDEGRFTEENYLKALKGLKFQLNNSGIDPWPYLAVLEGFLLKQAAIEEMTNNKKDYHYDAYCEFIVQQGVHRD